MSNKKEIKTSIITILLIVTGIILLAQGGVKALTTTGPTQGKNLTIWDQTDNMDIWSNTTITFNANYTNTLGQVVNEQCQIQIQNYTHQLTEASWENMTFNSETTPYYYNITLHYKGTYYYNINCSNATFSMNLTENYTILNSAPIISTRPDDFIELDTNIGTLDYLQCEEDSICIYNFTKNITELDLNDVLVYAVTLQNTTLTNYTFDTETGLLTINITSSIGNETGTKRIRLQVTDTGLGTDSGILNVNITPTNDAPVLHNIENWTINATSPGNNLETIIYGIDEEGNVPLTYNVTFSTCHVAEWSTRNGTPNNCTIWSPTDYNLSYNDSAMIINFTPIGRDDVGSYIINISVTDNGTNYGFETNAQRNYSINFTVNNVNQEPNITYICGQEVTGAGIYINTTENQNFECIINASDIDETTTLTFASDYTWLLNNTNGTFSDYNGSAIINITTTDYVVGNWSVNISVHDNTGTPSNKYDYEIIRLYIENVNDNVTFPNDIENFTGFTGNTYSIYVNATDNDLLIPGKDVYNESLNYSATNLSGTVIPWLTITKTGTQGNLSMISLTFTGNATTSGNTTINLSVIDSNGYSSDSRVFSIQIIGNDAPAWDESYPTNITLTEGTQYYENLTLNVTDSDGNAWYPFINFTYRNFSGTTFAGYFAGAGIDGIIDFTPTDREVGQHVVVINATDGKTPTPITVTYTVNNVNDAPVFGTITGSGSTFDEDSSSSISIEIFDEDLKILQKNYYNENITLNYTIDGPNTNLINLTKDSEFPNAVRPNLTIYSATFTPNKSDVGSYTIYVQAEDNHGVNITTFFNFDVTAINHEPIISEIVNQTTAINENYTLNITVTDTEDGTLNGDGTTNNNFTFTYTFLQGEDFINNNETIFNTTSGVINITFNNSHAGAYRINVTVNDSNNEQGSKDFWINVYDSPRILTISPGIINTEENNTIMINASAIHSVADYLNYSIIIDGIVRNSTLGVGDGSANVSMTLYLNFSDETSCTSTGMKNLTINITTQNYEIPKYENNTLINLTVNHTNYPLTFLNQISNTTAGGSVSYSLNTYFKDLDLTTDTCNNETVVFTYIAMDENYTSIGESIFTIKITNSTTTNNGVFEVSSGGSEGTEAYQIIGNDSYVVAKSNNFSISLSPDTITQEVPSASTGGGGGGSVRPVSLKILFPSDVSAHRNDQIIIPLTLYNNGQSTLNGIDLTGTAARNGSRTDDVTLEFGQSEFLTLAPGARTETNLTLNIRDGELGRYEVLVNATVQNPQYTDWGQFFLDIRETNQTEVEKIILFTEELLVGNPECSELQEVLREAQAQQNAGNYEKSYELANNAVVACRNAITQKLRQARETPGSNKNIVLYVSFTTLAVLFLIFAYHLFNRIRMKQVQNDYLTYEQRNI